ncbi:hypothetical protein ABK040_015025 [Willaertia magna]
MSSSNNNNNHYEDEELIDFSTPKLDGRNITTTTSIISNASESEQYHQNDNNIKRNNNLEETTTTIINNNNYAAGNNTVVTVPNYNSDDDENMVSLKIDQQLENEERTQDEASLSLEGHEIIPNEIKDSKRIESESFISKLITIFLNLFPFGFLSYGNSVTNLGLLEEQFVFAKRWMTDIEFIELISLTQIFPGPTSTQMMILIGTLYSKSFLGGIFGFLLFVLPSTILLFSFGLTMQNYGKEGINTTTGQSVDIIFPNWVKIFIKGFSLGTLAIVLKACYVLCKSLLKHHEEKLLHNNNESENNDLLVYKKNNRETTIFIKGLIIFSCIILLILPYSWMIIVVMSVGTIFNLLFSIYIENYMFKRIKKFKLKELKEFLNEKEDLPIWRIIIWKFYLFFSTFRKNNNNHLELQQQQELEQTIMESVEEQNSNNQQREEEQVSSSLEQLEEQVNNNDREDNDNNNENNIVLTEQQQQQQQQTMSTIQQQQEEDNQKQYFIFKPLIGLIFLIILVLILLFVFIFKFIITWKYFQLFSGFYKIGSLLLGGGDALKPMISNEFSTLLNETQLNKAFEISSLMPGSIFNISMYLGIVIGGIPGGLISWIAVFLPSFLMVYGVLPFWKRFREKLLVQQVFEGVNAVAIGFCISATFILSQQSVGSDVVAAITVACAFGVHVIFEFIPPVAVFSGGVIRFLLYLILNR